MFFISALSVNRMVDRPTRIHDSEYNNKNNTNIANPSYPVFIKKAKSTFS